MGLERMFAAAACAALALLAGCTSGEGPAPPAGGGTKAAENAGGVMPTEAKGETVILAGGCFWGMEELLRNIPGVLATEAGYCGGPSEGATYEVVKTGRSGHAESVKVVYDPAKLPFETLLRDWFFRMHDPTTLDRQGNDVGSQYRSAIFWTTEEQRAAAERVKAAVDGSGKWKRPVVTVIEKAGPWSAAEEHHQDYLQKHPDGYTCHWLRD